MWVIIKKIKTDNGTELPVIILNSQYEIWEFETLEEAENMKSIFMNNSDSKHEYVVMKI
jgi:hypothetical protein